ncbi:uncharacterized protein LOC131069096 isoform X1 [Cryptomeria japonica]|uniref:uncharacterized protein LOC131069096 isoform X1 n=1 Tax=Cryptomeria japonica TaxID=3369 RepID=UPI0025AD665A|nr:uncharacterized protein LOC131069096 isoform X1 [Cryptomeria japonica]
MEKSMLKCTQIPCAPGISCDHKKWDSGSSIKPISCGYGGNYNFKGTSLKLSLRSDLKPILCSAKGSGITNRRGLLFTTISSSNNGGDDAPDQSKQNISIFSVFAGIIGYSIMLYRGEKTLEKVEEKVENTVEIVEEVANAAKRVSDVTEDLAELIEKQTKDGGIVHETAEFVEEISKTVGRDAEIVENQAEKIKKTIKSMDEEVGKAEDAVKHIAEIISEEKVSKETDKDMGTS